jgi:hypothetical protein
MVSFACRALIFEQADDLLDHRDQIEHLLGVANLADGQLLEVLDQLVRAPDVALDQVDGLAHVLDGRARLRVAPFSADSANGPCRAHAAGYV